MIKYLEYKKRSLCYTDKKHIGFKYNDIYFTLSTVKPNNNNYIEITFQEKQEIIENDKVCLINKILTNYNIKNQLHNNTYIRILNNKHICNYNKIIEHSVYYDCSFVLNKLNLLLKKV